MKPAIDFRSSPFQTVSCDALQISRKACEPQQSTSMPSLRKTVKLAWIRPSAAAQILGCHQSTVTYRAGKGLYRTKHDAETGVTLVNRRDVERDAKARAKAKAEEPDTAEADAA